MTVVDPNTLQDAVVASLKARLGPRVSVEPHAGVFSEEDMERYGAACPAVRVALPGFGRLERASSGEAIVPVRLAAVCLARDTAQIGTAKIDRRVAVQALATAVTLAVDKQQWDLAGVMLPEEIVATNQFAGAKADKAGIAFWQVMWTSRVLMGEGIDITLAALSTLYVDQVLFSGPGATPGADPLRDPPTQSGGTP